MANTFQNLVYEFDLAASGVHAIQIRSTTSAASLYKYKVTGNDTKFDDTKIKVQVLTGGTWDATGVTSITSNFSVLQNGNTTGLAAHAKASAFNGSVVVDGEFLNPASRGGENPGLSLATNDVVEFRFTADASLSGTSRLMLVVSLER